MWLPLEGMATGNDAAWPNCAPPQSKRLSCTRAEPVTPSPSERGRGEGERGARLDAAAELERSGRNLAFLPHPNSPPLGGGSCPRCVGRGETFWSAAGSEAPRRFRGRSERWAWGQKRCRRCALPPPSKRLPCTCAEPVAPSPSGRGRGEGERCARLDQSVLLARPGKKLAFLPHPNPPPLGEGVARAAWGEVARMWTATTRLPAPRRESLLHVSERRPGVRTNRMICQRSLQPTGRFRRRSLGLV